MIAQRFRRAAVLAALAPMLFSAGCMSAGKRLEQGMKLEERGRPADAAQRYIDALRRDPSLVEARARLEETGNVAVQQYLDESEAASAAGQAEDAADLLLRLDVLRRDAAAVRVALAVPEDYTRHRREVLDAAIEASIERGGQMQGAGRFNDALGRLDRAVDRWQPSAEQRARVDRARVDTYVAWAQREADQGRFRASYDVSARAMRAIGRDVPGMDQLADLQAFALEEGTVRVAVLPVTSETGVDDELPVEWLRDVEDALEEGAWDRPPLFVEVIDSRDVRRELRRQDGAARPRVSASQAASVGRALGADLVVRMRVDSIRSTERGLTTERRPARLRTGADTAYTLRQGVREVRVRLRYDVVDVADRREVLQDDVYAEGEAEFREATFQGNWRQLMLGREEQALFEADSRRDERHAVWRSLSEEMVERVQRDLLDRLGRLVD